MCLGAGVSASACAETQDNGPCVGLFDAATAEDTSPDAPPNDTGAEPDASTTADAHDDAQECPTCPGAPLNTAALEDVQPSSCLFGTSYGLDVFEGRTTVVALLAAW